MPEPARRKALKAGLAAGSAALAASVALPARAEVAKTKAEAFAGWDAVRKRFNLAKHAPFNAANLTPAYSSVLRIQADYAERLSADVSFINRRDFIRDKVATARQACAEMLAVSAEEIAFVRNTSEANATVISGLNLAPDSEVLLWDQNHSTNYRSWHYQHQRRPFVVRQVALPPQAQTAEQLMQPFLDALSPKTAVVSLSHVSNVSGMRLPLAALCKAIKAYRSDIYIHIDGAQSFGSVAVDLSAVDCDSYAAPTHKWLCGPRGVGLLVVKQRAVERLLPLQVGYDMEYNYPVDELSNTAHRFECLGQRDTAAIGAVAEAVYAHQSIGMPAIEQRIGDLTEYTKQAFANAGIETITPQQRTLSHGVVVADVGGKLKAIAAFLALHNAGYAAAFVHGQEAHCDIERAHGERKSPTWLRLCPHIYNNEADIDDAVAIVKRTTESTIEMLKEAWQFL